VYLSIFQITLTEANEYYATQYLLMDKLNIKNELVFVPLLLIKTIISSHCWSTRFFLLMCEQWRIHSGTIPDDVMGDVYDACLWKDFMTDRYDNFLKYPGNLLLSINCDLFQPFSTQ